MDAPEENGARLAPDAVFMMSGEVALEPVPHRRVLALFRRFGCLPYGKENAAVRRVRRT